MPRTWLAIRVELLGGRGDELWPPPGRVIAVGPSHTFADLARAIDDFFARWDRAHLCRFTLSDGSVVTDEDSMLEAAAYGPEARQHHVLARTKVSSLVGPGDELSYVFDLGDDWTHRCTVEAAKQDPVDLLGATPRSPAAYDGWGAIPDQYGRRWQDDDGQDPPPLRSGAPDPMLTGEWPLSAPAQPADLRELRGATARRDLDAILAAVEGRDIDDLLQHVGLAAQIVLAMDQSRGESLAESVVDRLGLRGAVGDAVLAEDLLAVLRDTPLAVRSVAVDLSELASEIEGSIEEESGYLDVRTGEVIPHFLTDAGEVGEDDAIDIDDEPDRWVPLDRLGSRAGWRDMADFAARERSADVRRRLEASIQGRGAFRRFRDAVADVGLMEQWHGFADDRSLGRARDYLDDLGYRASPRV